MPQTRLESPFPFDISVPMVFMTINVHLTNSCFLSWLAAAEKNSNDGANSLSPWGVWFPFTDLALQAEVQLNINCINCSTAHLSWESLFAPDYAKNRSCLVLSQARGFSFPLAANFLIWLILPCGCLCTTSQQLLQTWSTLACRGLLCSVDRAGVRRLLLETSPVPPPGHSLGRDAEQSQEACQGVFSQRNQVLHYLNWTISPLPDWPLRVTNEVENSFSEAIWLTHLCSQVAEWGLLWPLPLSLLSQHTLRSVIPCCCSCLLADFGLSGHLWVSWLHGNSPCSQQTGLCFQLWGFPVWLDAVCSMCRCCLKSSSISTTSCISTALKKLLDDSSFFIWCFLL